MSQLQVKPEVLKQQRDGPRSSAADVAVAFFSLMYDKKYVGTKSPGPVPRVSKVLQDGGDQEIRANAAIIAQRLATWGDELEKRIELIAALREEFEKEFKLQNAFKMAYKGFSRVCLRFLSRTQGQIRTGWDQVYLLFYGHYIVGEELARQAGPDSRERITAMATYVDEIMHDIRLDEWVEAQGGMERSGAQVIVGEQLVDVPDPEGTSVDN